MPSIGIAVFGSSEPRPGDRLYATAEEVGGLLARAGYEVITGGYGGVMEGASRGARNAGGRTVGIGCATFTDRRPNPYLDEIVMAPDLFARTRDLIQRARGYVVLNGKSGTLAELAQLWALDRAGCLDGRPVILLGGAWRELVNSLTEIGMLELSQSRITQVVERPEEAVSALISARLPASD